MRLGRAVGIAVLGLTWAVAARSAPQSAPERRTLAGHPVAIWRPAATTGKAPLVLFSHGFHGSAEQSRQVMAALANAGYLVVAPDHADASVHHPSWKPDESFKTPGAWNASTYAARGQDLRDVYGALAREPDLRGIYDHHRVALVGHSLGGYTVLGLAGAWPSWWTSDLHVRAVVAWSPYCKPFLTQQTLGQLRVPVMYQGATLDFAITPTLRGSDGAYALSPPPKCFVELRGAGHLAWTNLRADKDAVVTRYTLAFLNHFVKGERADPILRQPLPGVRSLQYQE